MFRGRIVCHYFGSHVKHVLYALDCIVYSIPYSYSYVGRASSVLITLFVHQRKSLLWKLLRVRIIGKCRIARKMHADTDKRGPELRTGRRV